MYIQITTRQPEARMRHSSRSGVEKRRGDAGRIQFGRASARVSCIVFLAMLVLTTPPLTLAAQSGKRPDYVVPCLR